MVLGILFGLFLAYANGANDNFKGVATLFGSKTTNYKQALTWAAATTFAGSVTAIFVANGLLEAFKGKGLVPEEVATSSRFGLSVVISAAITVMLATRFGFPISTTHSLIGGLVGAGLLASQTGIHGHKLMSGFLTPLLVSPIIAVSGAVLLYPVFRYCRRRLGVEKETCLCVGNEVIASAPASTDISALKAIGQETYPTVQIGTEMECREAYTGHVVGVRAEILVNRAHFLSAGAVSFARGLNDAPKIAALMLVGGAISPWFALAAVAVAMMAGGILSVRRVAETMALKVTKMNHGQGFTANIVTSLLVIIASKVGVPVSTTHVSCGSLFGIGAVTGQAHWKIIGSILTAWIVTLPIAGLIGAVTYMTFAILG
jgi:PiT family inorganic phosphate transporter